MAGTVSLTVFANGQQVAIPANIGKYSDNTTALVSSANANGQLAFDDAAPRTLGDFFQIWRTNAGLAGNNANAALSSNALMGNTASATSTVQMFVNGQVSRDFDSHVLTNGENIVLAYGSNPIVSLNTNFGPIVIELFETQTPGTVANFLNYVNRGDYNSSVFHRVDDNFVVQGGGFKTNSTTFTSTAQFTEITTDPPIQNEPGISNTRRTVAMAKTSDPNSATSQFFVNLSNDNTFLDSASSSGGFTAFGQVLDMTAADAISLIPVNSINPSPFGELPVAANNQLPVIQTVTGLGDLTGTAFTDSNANGVRDAGEGALSGITVFVDANGNGQLDTGEASATTDTNGQFLVQALPGSRTLRAVVPAGKTVSSPAGGSYVKTLEIGRAQTGLLFGFATPATDLGITSGFTGAVYVDANQNSKFDTGEAGVPGVMITLSGSAGSTPLVRTTITDNGGAYRFDDVPTGTYALVERQPSALRDGADSTSIAGAVTGNDQFSNIVFTSGQKLSGNNFGESEVLPELINISWFFVSAGTSQNQAFRQVVARSEESMGDAGFAAAIRGSSSESPPASSTAPVSNGDSYSINVGNTLEVSAADGILKNDTDADQNGLSAVLVSNTTHGTLNLRTNGSFTYSPNAGYSGSDSFAYAASDGVNTSNVSSVSLLIVGVNGVPTAANDTYSTDRNTPLVIAAVQGVLKNDVDPENAALSAQIVANPTHGTVTLDANGGFTYTPANNYSGSDSFTYRASDGANHSNVATVTLAVLPPPTGVADTYSVNENTTLTVVAANGVLANDTNPDSGPLTAILGTATTHGTLNLNSDGSFSYIPSANYFGSDLFTYQASKGTRKSEPVTVTINVASVNSTPVAVNNLYSVNEDTALTIAAVNGVLANDTDADGDPLTATKLSNPSSGTLTFNANGSLTYTPVANFNGSTTFTYSVSDGQATSPAATVTILVAAVNDPPTAVDDTYAVASNGVLTVNAATGVIANDSDIDGDGLKAEVNVAPTHGVLTIHEDGSFVYSPNAGFRGTDTFKYQINDIPPGSDCELVCNADGSVTGTDGLVHTAIGTVTIQVNDPPVAVSDTYSATEETVLTVPAATGVLGNDTDADSSNLTAAIAANAGHGQVVLNANGSFTYTPAANFSGVDTFTYTASDGFSSSAATTVTIQVANVNDAPTGAADNFTTAVNVALTIPASGGVLANDQDADGDPLTAIVITSTAHGSLDLSAGGGFTYTPNANFHGSDSFEYRVSDGQLTSANIGVTIVVNSAPLAANDTYQLNEDAVLAVGSSNNVMANDIDVDGDALTATIVSTTTHGQLQFNQDGTFSYSPTANFNGTDSFSYRIADAFSQSLIATVNITVVAVNDAPIAVNDSYSANEDQTLNVAAATGLLANDTDIDSAALSASLSANAGHGTVVVNANGSFAYTPAANFNGTDSFRYRVSDGQANSIEALVTLTVGGQNDAPHAANNSYTVSQNGVLTVNAATGVLVNDTDSDGDALTSTVIANPTHGTLALNANGSFTYTPTAGFAGADSFTYVANDGRVNSTSATVSIQVLAPNTFNLVENSVADTVVGQVVPTGTIGATRVYDFVNASLPADLQLAADDHFAGDMKSEAVLIEYLDIQCPPCGTYHPIIRQLETQFDGQLLVVRRHLPLTSIHFNALAAAKAAEAAGRQGKFDEFINLAYTNQSAWSSLANPQPQFDSFATTLGLNLTQFHTDSADPVIAARVQRDMDAAARMNVNSTPTFFLNGQKLSGPPATTSGFGALIQTALNQTSAAFSLNRLTGELRVATSSLINRATNPTFTLSVRVRDLSGVNQVIPVTVNVVSAASGEGADAFAGMVAGEVRAASYASLADEALNDVNSWLDTQ